MTSALWNELDHLRRHVNRLGGGGFGGGLGDLDTSLGGTSMLASPFGQRLGRSPFVQRGFELEPSIDSWGMFDDDFFDTPLLMGGGEIGSQQRPQKRIGGRRGRGAGKGEEEEVKMIDTGVQPSTQLTQQQGGALQPIFQPDRLMRARVNIEDAKDKYIVTADLPAFDKQNVKINVTEDGILTIKGEQSQEWIDQSKDKRYLCTERTFSNVHRTLRVPKDVDTSKIQANLENGVLHINLPKQPGWEKKQKAIQIA